MKDATRQPRGEGSRPWYSATRNAYRVRLPRVPGRTRPEYWVPCSALGEADTKALAEAWKVLRRQLTKAEDSGVVRNEDRRIKVGAWVTRYVEELAPNLRESSRRVYQPVARTIARDPIANVLLTALRADDVAAMLRRLERSGMSANRRYQILVVLRTAIEGAVMAEKVGRNVARLIAPPKRRTATIHPPTPDEVDRVLRLVEPDPTYGALYAICIATGIRQGEALALRWADIVPDATGRTWVHVEGTLPDRSDHRAPTPKTESGVRRIPLAPEVVELLRVRKRFQLENGSTSREGLVFTVPDGHQGRHRAVGLPLRAESVRSHWRRVQRQLGIGPYRWHDFRHEAASRMLAAGADIESVRVTLGHASLVPTSRYVHSTADVAAALDPYAARATR